MKGETVCRRFHLPKELLEGPVLNALVRRLRAMGRIDNIRAQVKAMTAELESPENSPAMIRRRIEQVEEKCRNWEAAIEKGLNMEVAVEKLKALANEKATLERELAAAKARASMNVNVQDVSNEIMANLDRMQEVLEKGSVAEVKAILRAYIGRVEYDPETNRARIGFLRMPTRALVSELAPESARISMVAGARSKAEKL